MSIILSTVGDLLGRNRSRFVWIGGTIGGGYALYKYANWKWSEFQSKRELEQAAKAKWVVSFFSPIEESLLNEMCAALNVVSNRISKTALSWSVLFSLPWASTYSRS